VAFSSRSLGHGKVVGRPRAVAGCEPTVLHLQPALDELVSAAQQLPYRDLLGSLYMEARRADRARPQFFVPWPAAKLIARTYIGALQLDRYDPETPLQIFDPACGPGTLLLATPSELPEALLSAEAVRFAGVDVDPMCVALTRLNLRLYGLEHLTTFVSPHVSPELPFEGERLLVLR